MAVGFLQAAGAMTVPAPAWTTPIDPAEPHWAYTWTAQYDNENGLWLSEVDAHFRACSAAALDPTRLWRLVFSPPTWREEPGLPTLDFRAQLVVGEVLKTWWTVDKIIDTGESIVHRVVQLIQPGDGDFAISTFTFIASDGSIRMGSRRNW